MSPHRARIIRAAEVDGDSGAKPIFSPLSPGPSWRRRIAREEIEAHLAAERILFAARSQAEDVLARARDDAARALAEGAREAREKAEAALAARWLLLRQEEGERLDRDRDRMIAVAVALAERLLGAALELDPSRIVDLALTAVAEARGAQRIAIEAHPLDAEALRGHLRAAALGSEAAEVRPDESLARGELRLQTDVGTVDAKLSPRLERLAAALRDALP